VQPITSLKNPKIKRLRSLRQRKYRQREGVFAIEGIRIVEEALAANASIETLVYAPELLVSERAQAVVERVSAANRMAVSGDVLRSLSTREQPQGIVAVVRIEHQTLSGIPVSDSLFVVVAVQLRGPGNLGAIVRTADAAGATGVVVVGPAADLYDPQAVRATMGSLFALPVICLPEEQSLLDWLAVLRAAAPAPLIVATSAHGEVLYFAADYNQPVVLLLGGERYGLSPEIRESADVTVRLPISGRATSLNVSAAAAALMYEVVRQRKELAQAKG
jgi:TrmH family RNA methyltransferase